MVEAIVHRHRIHFLSIIYPQNINSVLHVPYKNNKKGLFPTYRVKLFFISGFLFHTPML